jgi:hypothetical protein
MRSKCAPRIIKAIEPTDQFFLRPHSVVAPPSGENSLIESPHTAFSS